MPEEIFDIPVLNLLTGLFTHSRVVFVSVIGIGVLLLLLGAWGALFALELSLETPRETRKERFRILTRYIVCGTSLVAALAALIILVVRLY